MQEVKVVVRQIGIPDVQLDVISPDDLNEYVAYQYTSQGYNLVGVPNYLGEVKNGNGNVVGWKFALWFARDEAATKVKAKKDA